RRSAEPEGNLLNPRQPISLAQLLISWRSMCSCTRTPGLDMPMLRTAWLEVRVLPAPPRSSMPTVCSGLCQIARNLRAFSRVQIGDLRSLLPAEVSINDSAWRGTDFVDREGGSALRVAAPIASARIAIAMCSRSAASTKRARAAHLRRRAAATTRHRTRGGNHECIGFLNSRTLIPRLGEAMRRGFGGYLTPRRQSALVAALACASLLAVTPCVAAESAATQGGSKSPSAAMAKVAAKAAKKAASTKSREKKSASGKPTVAAVPLPRARLGSSGASARARAASGPQGASTDLAKPPAVPLAQAPTPQTSDDPDVALVKS